MRHGWKLIGVLALTAGLAVTTGCSKNRKYGFLPQDARLIGQETVDRIKPGETTADWIEAVLGSPSDEEPLAFDHQEVWKYRYQMVGGSYRLHGRSRSHGTVRTLYIQLASGTVTDVWMD